MLEIRNATGLTLQLPPDSRLSVELVSTLFNTDDVLPGSYSYPFRFPLSEGNRRFVNNGHRIEVAGQAELPVQVAAGSHSFTALLGYKAQGLYADAWLLVDLGAVADGIRKQSLRGLVTETFLLGNTGFQIAFRLKELATAAPGEFPIVFPPHRNDEMVDGDFRPSEAYTRPLVFNRYNPNVGTYVVSGYDTDGAAQLVPCVYLTWLIRHLCAQLGYTARGSLFTDVDLNRLVLLNTQALPGYQHGQPYLVDIGRHLPDMSISEFFRALRGWLGLGIWFEAGTRSATFNTYRSMRLTRAAGLDLTAGYVPGQDAIENPALGGYVVNSALDSQDQLLSERVGYRKSYTTGTPAQEVTLSVGTTYMSRESNYDHAQNLTWLIPHLKKPGNVSDPFFQESNTFVAYERNGDSVPETRNGWGLLLLLYHGMQPDASELLYPFATSVSYNARYQGLGTLSLLPGEPDDVWKRYQRYYYQWLAQARLVEQPLRLTLSQLNHLRLDTPVLLQTTDLVRGRYLIERLTYELPAADGQVLARMRARQLVPLGIVAANEPETNLYLAVWVYLELTNYTRDDFTTNYQYDRYDVVVSFYEDGTRQTPISVSSLLINYRLRTQTYDASGNMQQEITDLSATVFGTSYTLYTQEIIREEERYEDPELPQTESWRTVIQKIYDLLPGDGYRVVL